MSVKSFISSLKKGRGAAPTAAPRVEPDVETAIEEDIQVMAEPEGETGIVDTNDEEILPPSEPEVETGIKEDTAPDTQSSPRTGNRPARARHLKRGVFQTLLNRNPASGDTAAEPDRTGQDVPDPPQIRQAVLTSYGGVNAVCNLDWESTSERRRLSSTSSSRPLYLTAWGDRKVVVDGAELEGSPALLELINANLTSHDRAGAVMVAYADAARNLWISAVLVDGKPALGPEHSHNSQSDIVAHISNTDNTAGIVRVMASESLITDLDVQVPVLPLSNTQLDPRQFATFTRKAQLFSKPAKLAMGGFAGASIVAASVLFLLPVLTAPREVPAAPVLMATYVEDFSQFRTGCASAFEGPWPTAPGWLLQHEGCASKLMRDPELTGVLKEPAAAYQVFTLKSEHNAILSRRAAELIYQDWPHQARLDRGRLLVLKPFDIDLVPYVQPSAPAEPGATNAAQPAPAASLLDQVENAFIGIEAGVSAITNSGTPLIHVTTGASLSEVLRRIETLTAASLALLKRDDGTITLQLSDPQTILRPASRAISESG